MKKEVLFVLIFFIMSPSVYSAIISGTVYDISLKKVENIVVEINSSPKQRIVAVDGTYSVNLPLGNYMMSVNKLDGNTNYSATEYLEVIDGGEYKLDLFLYPNFDEYDELIDEVDIDIPEPEIEKMKNTLGVIIPLFGIFIFLFFIFFFHKKRKKEKEEKTEKIIPGDSILDDDLQEIIYLLQKNNNRMTQKEIRKEFSLSESKISLMIAELEDMGLIKKIKKGRGNIIILR